MEVQILFGSSRLKFICDFSHLILGILVAPWIRECKIGRLISLIAEHVLESESELIFLVDEVICLSENASPFLLSVWEDSEYWLKTLPIQLCLIVQVLECECQLLTLWYTFYREVEPCLVPIILVRCPVVANPKQVFIFLVSFLNSSEIASTEVTVKSYCCIFAFLELLSHTLGKN